jgi:hypothetical protein
MIITPVDIRGERLNCDRALMRPLQLALIVELFVYCEAPRPQGGTSFTILVNNREMIPS